MKKKSMYEITDEVLELNKLMNSLEDEDGNPREPNEEELEIMKGWFNDSEAEFKNKFDNYCKFIKNLKIEAEIAKAEKDAHKKELDRLSKRASAFENRSKSVQGILWGCMQRLGLASGGFKTTLFSAKEQNTQISIKEMLSVDYSKIPEEFLKPREIDKMAIKKAINAGILIKKENTVGNSIVFEDGEALEGVYWTQGRALVIR